MNEYLREQDCSAIQDNVNQYKKIPEALPLITSSVDVTKVENIRNMHGILRQWGDIELHTALNLLTSTDPIVRAFAVERLDSLLDDRGLMIHMLQFVQALKMEPCHDRHPSPLAAPRSFLHSTRWSRAAPVVPEMQIMRHDVSRTRAARLRAMRVARRL